MIFIKITAIVLFNLKRKQQIEHIEWIKILCKRQRKYKLEKIRFLFMFSIKTPILSSTKCIVFVEYKKTTVFLHLFEQDNKKENKFVDVHTVTWILTFCCIKVRYHSISCIYLFYFFGNLKMFRFHFVFTIIWNMFLFFWLMDRLFAGHTYNCAFRVYSYNNKAHYFANITVFVTKWLACIFG